VVIVTILPILLPLVAAFASVLVPIRVCQTSWYRLIRLAFLVIVAGFLVKVPTLTTGTFNLSLSVTGLVNLPPLAFIYTSTGLAAGLVYLGSQFLTTLGNPSSAHPYPKRSLELVQVSCVLAICMSANIITVCFGWMATSMLILMRRMSISHEDPTAQVSWDLLGSLGSLILVMIVAILAIIEQRANSFGDLATSPYMVTLLFLAALLRLGVFPLPTNRHMNWVDKMAALCSGMWLILRLASVGTQSIPGWQWLAPVIVSGSVIAALLANLMISRELGREYLMASLVGVMILAPMLAPSIGTGLAVLFLVNMVLVIALVDQTGEGMSNLQFRFLKWLKVISILNLMGVPLTLGFLSRWELQRLVGSINQKATVIVLTMCFTLITLYLWRQLDTELRQGAPQSQSTGNPVGNGSRENWVICILGVLFVLIELIIGLVPRGMNIILPTPLSLPDPRQNLSASVTTWIYLIVTTLIIPIAGAFFIFSQRTLFKLSSSLFEAVRWVTRLDWVYYSLGKLFGWASRVGALVLNSIERKYLLGWVLIWVVIIIAFLVGT
jgi:hypothetical protein